MPALSAWNRYLESQGFKMAYMFRKNQAESDSVPPTQGHFMKQFSAHYQMIVWDNDKVRCPSLPQPGEFRWEKTVDE